VRKSDQFAYAALIVGVFAFCVWIALQHQERDQSLHEQMKLFNQLREGCWYSKQGQDIIVECPELAADAGLVTHVPACHLMCEAVNQNKYMLRVYRAGEEKR